MESNRGKSIRRVLELILMLSTRGYTTREAAAKLGVSIRTVRRDLIVIGELHIPIYNEKAQLEAMHMETIWRVEPRWISRRISHD